MRQIDLPHRKSVSTWGKMQKARQADGKSTSFQTHHKSWDHTKVHIFTDDPDKVTIYSVKMTYTSYKVIGFSGGTSRLGGRLSFVNQT